MALLGQEPQGSPELREDKGELADLGEPGGHDEAGPERVPESHDDEERGQGLSEDDDRQHRE